MRAFIDSNIPMYAAGSEHPAKQPCIELLRKIAAGDVDVVTDAEVFQEILHRYGAIGRLAQGLELFDELGKVVRIVLPVEYGDVFTARELLEEEPQIKARDAIHVAIMRRHGIAVVYSYDRHFDGLEGIERHEP